MRAQEPGCHGCGYGVRGAASHVRAGAGFWRAGRSVLDCAGTRVRTAAVCRANLCTTRAPFGTLATLGRKPRTVDMSLVKRICGAYCLVIAALAALNFMLTPVYNDPSANYPVWVILNWFMAVAVVITIVASVHAKVASDRQGDGPVDRAWISTNLLFMAMVVMTIWWFWNWLSTHFPGTEVFEVFEISEVVVYIHLAMWAFFNPLYVLTSGFAGWRLWREAADG